MTVPPSPYQGGPTGQEPNQGPGSPQGPNIAAIVTGTLLVGLLTLGALVLWRPRSAPAPIGSPVSASSSAPAPPPSPSSAPSSAPSAAPSASPSPVPPGDDAAGLARTAWPPSRNAAGAELDHLPVTAVSQVFSEQTGHTIILTFVNRSRRPVVVQWINSYGKPVTYLHLPAGQSYQQPTFTTHPWLVTSERGERLVLVIAGEEPGTVTVR